MKIQLNRPQMRFVHSEARHAMYCSGRGSGKTFVGCLWAVLQMLQHPGTTGLVGANVPRQLNDVVLRQMFALLREMGVQFRYGCKPPWGAGEDKDASYSSILSLQNGSSAYCRSMHIAGADNNLRGLQVAWAYVDEARDLEEESYNIALACLRGFPGADYQTRLTTTPSGYNWLHERFADPNSDRLMPNSELISGRTTDNWKYLPEDYESNLRATYSKMLARQELDGEFVNLRSGCVFQFDRARNLADIQYDPKLPLIFSADQNVHPYCGVIMQFDVPNRRAYVLDEVRIEDAGTTREWALEASTRYKNMATSVDFYCDPSSVKRDTRGGESDFAIMRAELQKHFARVRDASDRRVQAVSDGVNSINSMLDPAVGPPRLMVDRKCKELIKDLIQMQYVEGSRKMDKSDPARTHHADAVRYPIQQNFPVHAGKIEAVDLW